MGNVTPHDSEDNDDPLRVQRLEAQEDMTGKAESDWTTLYVQYLTCQTHGTPWVSSLPKEERKLIGYRSRFFILKEGKLHRIFHNNIIKICIPGRYMRSYIKTLHVHKNRHYLINATKQLVLQGLYWWPTIAEDVSLLITLCTECKGQGEELPTKESFSQPSDRTDIIPCKKTFSDWRTPLVEYMAHGKFKMDAETQREQRETIRESEIFTLEKGKLRKIEKNGMTKICIADYHIKRWIGKMHVYQQSHLNDQHTWLRCLQGNRRWPTMGLSDIQMYIMYDCSSCRTRFRGPHHNIICGSIIVQPHDHKDLRRWLIEYLTYGYLKRPRLSKNQHKRITRQCQADFIEEGKLKRILSNGDLKICIVGREIEEYLKELHITESGEHLRVEIMWHLLMFGPYWWPTCGANIKNLCNHKCTICSNQPEFPKDEQNQSQLGRKELPKTPTTDWRRPYMEYLTCEKIFTQNLTPADKRVVEHIHKYFVFTEGTLQKIHKGGNSNQRCIPEIHIPMYLANIHIEIEPHLAAMETWKAVAASK